MHAQKLFQERLKNGSLNCWKGVGHEECSSYRGRKIRHAVEASVLKDEANFKARSIYVAVSKEVVANGKVVQIRGGIKSLDTPCKEEASSSGEHPYTRDNCYLQLHELQIEITPWKMRACDFYSRVE